MAKEKLQGFEESLLEVRKVTKVTTGGRRMRFRATVLVGDRAGHIGLGVGKGNDVSIAVSKATHDAYKNVTVVPVTKSGSVPYMITQKYKSCMVMLRPATTGTGLKAGSSVRTVLELAGFSNILSKIIGSNNSLNNAIAVINALLAYKVNPDTIQAVKELVMGKVEDRNDRNSRPDRRDNNQSRPQRPTREQSVATPAHTAETKTEEMKTEAVAEKVVAKATITVEKVAPKKTPTTEKSPAKEVAIKAPAKETAVKKVTPPKTKEVVEKAPVKKAAAKTTAVKKETPTKPAAKKASSPKTSK